MRMRLRKMVAETGAAVPRQLGRGGRRPARAPSLARTPRTRQLFLDSESTFCPALLPTSPPVRFAAPASSSPALISSPPTSLNSPRPPRAAMKATIPRRALADVLKRRPDDVVVRPLFPPPRPSPTCRGMLLLLHQLTLCLAQIVTSLRTPIGKFRGGLKDMHAEVRLSSSSSSTTTPGGRRG